MIAESILLSKIETEINRPGDENIDEEYMLQYRYQKSSVSRADLNSHISYMEVENNITKE